MIISNYKKVATSPARKKVLNIFDRAMRSVTAEKIMRESIKIKNDFLVIKGKPFSIKNRRIFVVGMGKISAHMAVALEGILGVERIAGGVVISPPTSVRTAKIRIHIADHPVPSKRSLAGGRAIRSLKEEFKICKNDLIIALVSGGGSSLAVEPVAGVSLRDKQKMTEILLGCGASGYDNTRVKAVLSKIKGGALAQYFAPTPIISLIISDDNGLAGHDMTASGPFSKNRPNLSEALAIISKYKIINKIPKSILNFLNGKEEKKEVNNVTQFILLDNTNLLGEIKLAAQKEGVLADVFSCMQGDVQKEAGRICKSIQHEIAHKKPKLFVYGGETTVSLSDGCGVGGRNQEFAAICLEYFARHAVNHSWCLASIATDGVDCIRDSCGGIVDSDSIRIAVQKKLCPRGFILRHNVHPLLKAINGNLVIKTETATNLGDVVLCLIAKPN